MKRLHGKTVAITGATGGLGRAAAMQMAAEGANLVLTDRDPDALASLAAGLRHQGAAVVTHAGDVTQVETHAVLVGLAMDHFRGLHGLCNVAGVLGPGRLEEATTQSFDSVMHVNCLAQLLAIQQAMPALRANGGGSVVNVASVGALVALPMMSTYCASKAAVIGLTRAVAAELAPDVRCNAVCPGGVDTPMSQRLLANVPAAGREALMAQLVGRQHIKRFAYPEEIAPTLAFLISDEASFITGAVIAADGGHSSW